MDSKSVQRRKAAQQGKPAPDVVDNMLMEVLDDFINNMNTISDRVLSTRDCYQTAIRDIRKVFEQSWQDTRPELDMSRRCEENRER